MLLIALITYLAAGIAVTLFQRRLIYFPTVAASEAMEELARTQRLERWTSASGQAIGWKRAAPVQPPEAQVLITHGNAGCAAHRGFFADALQKVGAFDVFILEYPGYGDRAGTPGERSLYAAADEALTSLDPKRPIYLLGESLGTGVAAYLAGTHSAQVAGVLLIAPFNNLTAVAQRQMRVFPVRWMLRDRFPSDESLRHFHGPLAVLLAGRDEVIPNPFGRRLHDGYAGPKRLWEDAIADHNSLSGQPSQFWSEVVGFWQLPVH